MDIRVVLSKVVTLVYRTRLIGIGENDDLIRTILQTAKTDAPEFSFGNNNTPKKLKELCLELLDTKDAIAKEVLLPRLQLCLETDAKLYQSIKESIEPDYEDSSCKRIITSLVKLLHNYYREHQASDLINKAAYDLKFNRSKIGNFTDYLSLLMGGLEPLAVAHSSVKDPALVTEVDMDDDEGLRGVLEEVKVANSDAGVYSLGWQDLNEMTQGGGRRGETITVGALQHKYKTGFTLSLFGQIATNNRPIVFAGEEGKKPLLLRISFEDAMTNNLQFLYQYFKAVDGEPVKKEDFLCINIEEMARYVKGKLTATGFSVKMMRVDPSQWTYLSVINKVIELEAKGYCVHVLMLDYITMLPTTGCSTGPVGFDKRDLLRRLRNFCSARKTMLVTPLQLSTEAKQLIRNGVPEHDFVNQIAEKGYYDGVKSIDQDIDLELYIHLFSHKRKKYLAVRRGKHRLSTVIDDEAKYFILPFPGLNIPILEDINGEKCSTRKLPRGEGGDSSSNMLQELLG